MRAERGSPVFTLPGSGLLAAGVPERYVEDEHLESARLEGHLRVTDSASPLGPLIRCRASVLLPGLTALVVFRDRARRGDPSGDEVIRLIDMIRPGDHVTPIVERPLRGAPGRSVISIRMIDFEGWTLAEDQEVGECADGLLQVQASFVVRVKASAWLVARAWGEHGPRIGVSGEATFPGGVAMRVAVRPFGSASGGDDEHALEVPIIRPGIAWYASERVVEGRSPDHAWVFVRFTEGGARVVSDEHVVGHCTLIPPPQGETHRRG